MAITSVNKTSSWNIRDLEECNKLERETGSDNHDLWRDAWCLSYFIRIDFTLH